jgi:predicted RNA-binding protein with PIN domain
VVFDGWQQGGDTERQEHRAGLQVVYSRRGERADQVIQRLAGEYGRDCAVVSSDREVADFARANGAFVIAATEFESRLRVRPAMTAQSGPYQKDGPEEDLPRRNPEKKGNPRKLPKALRKRSRRLRGF